MKKHNQNIKNKKLNGKIFIDSMEPANEAIITLMKILIQYPVKELRKFERDRRKRYPEIKTAGDLVTLKEDSESFMNALSMFLIPMEIKSRETQRAYYGIL